MITIALMYLIWGIKSPIWLFIILWIIESVVFSPVVGKFMHGIDD